MKFSGLPDGFGCAEEGFAVAGALLCRGYEVLALVARASGLWSFHGLP
jgi:hypothetical protein